MGHMSSLLTRVSCHTVQIPLLKLEPAIQLVVGIERKGLDLIVRTTTGVKDIAEASVTLTLRWAEFVVIVAVTLLASLSVEFRHQIAATWIVAIWAPHNLVKAAAIVSAAVLAMGCLLAYWKGKQLFVYGVWEIVFGTWSAFQSALALWPHGETAKFVALASSIYVVSRGAGNVQQAVEDEAQRLKLDAKWTIAIWPFNTGHD
jgi:hypothetical protein